MLFNRFVLLLVLALCILCDVRCATGRGGQRAARVGETLETVAREVETADMTPENRKRIAKTIREQVKPVQDIGRMADDNQEAADKWKGFVRGGMVVGFLLVAAGIILYKFKK